MGKAEKIFCLFILICGFLPADNFFKVKQQIQTDYLFRLAPFYIRPTLSVENLGYSSNIYSYDKYTEPDWLADIGPDVNVALIFKNRVIVNARYFPYWSWYASNTQNRTWNNIKSGTIYTYLGRLNLQYQYEWANRTNRPTSEFGWRIWNQQVAHTFSIDYGSHNNFYLNLSGSQKKIEYKDERYLESEEVPNLLNHEETLVGVGLNKIVFSNTHLFLNVEHFIYRFSHVDGRDGKGEQISAGLTFPEKGRITGSFFLGYRNFRPVNPNFLSFSKPYGKGNLKIILFHRLRLNFEYVVDNYFSFYGDNIYFDDRTFRTGLEYYFTRKFKIGYQNTIGTTTYRFLEDNSIWRDGETFSHTIMVAFRFFRNVGIGLSYQVYSMNFTESIINRNYTFFGGNLIYDF